MAEPLDWRLQGQETYLHGAQLQWKRYRARDDIREHDHCAFCWAKLVDPEFSAEHRGLAQGEEAVSEGYATTSEHVQGAEYHWICARCFSDFAEAFEWCVLP